MKIAFISDIHGNMPAFEAALKAVARTGAETVICLGDLVQYGPEPEEAVKFAMEKKLDCVQGNCDRAAARNRQNTGEKFDNPHWRNKSAEFFQWTRDNLTAKSRKWLRHLPDELRFQIGKQTVLCVHGLPGKVDEPLPENAASEVYDEILARSAGATIVVCGLTHTPSIIRRPRGLILNPGSVGGGTIPSGGTLMVLTIEDKINPQVETLSFSYPIEVLEERYSSIKIGDLFLKCLRLGRDQRGNWHTDQPKWRQQWAELS